MKDRIGNYKKLYRNFNENMAIWNFNEIIAMSPRENTTTSLSDPDPKSLNLVAHSRKPSIFLLGFRLGSRLIRLILKKWLPQKVFPPTVSA